MWAIGVGDLGLDDEFFWNLNLPLLGKLLERWSLREEASNLRAGLIAATICNVNRSKSTEKVWTPFDFFPRKQELVIQTEEEMLLTMNAWVTRTEAN